jgi:hypothetical protein
MFFSSCPLLQRRTSSIQDLEGIAAHMVVEDLVHGVDGISNELAAMPYGKRSQRLSGRDRHFYIGNEDGGERPVVFRLYGIAEDLDGELVLKKDLLFHDIEPDDPDADIIEDIGVDALSQTGALADRTHPADFQVKTGILDHQISLCSASAGNSPVEGIFGKPVGNSADCTQVRSGRSGTPSPAVKIT